MSKYSHIKEGLSTFKYQLKKKHTIAWSPKYKTSITTTLNQKESLELAKEVIDLLGLLPLIHSKTRVRAVSEERWNRINECVTIEYTNKTLYVLSETVGNAFWDNGRNYKWVKLFNYTYKQYECLLTISPKEVDYILSYCSKFMTANEHKAWKHYVTQYKLNHSNYTTEVEINHRKAFNYKQGWMTEDSEILRLLKDGVDEFRKRVAARITCEHFDGIAYNYCPKCNQLARTPLSKQCRYCYHTWFDK